MRKWVAFISGPAPSAGIAYHKIISFLNTFWLQKVLK
jgi:hypothetical protein